MNESCFVQDRHAEPDFKRASSRKSDGRHSTLPIHIILILCRPISALTPKCCMLNGGVVNIKDAKLPIVS